MSRRDVVLLGFAGVAFIGAGAIYMTMGGSTKGGAADFPEGHAYVCLDCGNVTVLTHAELMEFKARAREAEDPDARKVPCAECGSRNTAQALRCPHCGQHFRRPGGRPVCPHCQKPFPSPFGDD